MPHPCTCHHPRDLRACLIAKLIVRAYTCNCQLRSQQRIQKGHRWGREASVCTWSFELDKHWWRGEQSDGEERSPWHGHWREQRWLADAGTPARGGTANHHLAVESQMFNIRLPRQRFGLSEYGLAILYLHRTRQETGHRLSSWLECMATSEVTCLTCFSP